MKKKLLFILAVALVWYIGYVAIYGGLTAATLAVCVLSTLWFGCLAAFTKRPRVPLPFFGAYPRRVFVAAYVALLSGVSTLICTGSVMFLLFSLVASAALTLQWWRPIAAQKMEAKRK
jgi:hypothetical protein